MDLRLDTNEPEPESPISGKSARVIEFVSGVCYIAKIAKSHFVHQT